MGWFFIISPIVVLANLTVGFVFFIYGLLMLSSSVQRSFSARLRRWIEYSVNRPWKGVLVGTGVTSIIQSSSATTVLVVGLVNAGIFTFYDSLGIIFGANIGTTITAQLVAFNLTKYAIYFLILGFFMWFLGKGKKKGVGEIIFYFGLLFYGLGLMETALGPLRDNPYFVHLILNLKNPLWGVLIGALFTAIVQSSSVTTSIVVILGIKGLINLPVAIPIILGANIGTTVTSLVASIGTSINARRSALAHLMFNVIGVLLFLPLIGPLSGMIPLFVRDVGKQIAFMHTIFNVTNTIIFLIIIKQFHRFIMKLAPGKEEVVKFGPKFLSKKFIDNPLISIKLASKEIQRQGELAMRMMNKAMKIILNKEIRNVRFIENTELVVDNLQKEIGVFLTDVSKSELSNNSAKQVSSYLAMVNDIERIGDHAVNLSEIGREINEQNIRFSKYAIAELNEIYDLVRYNVKNAISLIEKYDKKTAKLMIEHEKQVDLLVKKASVAHVDRLRTGVCNILAGSIYNDILNNLERVSDHCMNIIEEVESFAMSSDKIK